MSKKYWAIVPAAGIGSRMQSDTPKQYLTINGTTLLEHIVQRLCDYPKISGLVVAIHPEDQAWDTLAIKQHPKVTITHGGDLRQDSVLNGLKALHDLADPHDWTLVHDAARPCLSYQALDRLIAAVQDESVGGLLAIPTPDTMKQADDNERIEHTISRQKLWQAQTPQIFPFYLLLSALELARHRKQELTDEAMAMEALQLMPRLVPGEASNIKVTHPNDLKLAAAILQQENP